MKFEIGMVLVFHPLSGKWAAQSGATAVVTGEDRDYVYVKWDRDNPLSGKQMDGRYRKEDFQPKHFPQQSVEDFL